MINTLLDACAVALEVQGEPQSSFWLASQIMDMKLWRASEDEVRNAVRKDIKKNNEDSRFVEAAVDEFGLRTWTAA